MQLFCYFCNGFLPKSEMNKLFAFIIFCLSVFPCMAEDNNFVLVIDPGHGGKDVGAPGRNNYEKNINLGVALKFGEFVEKRMDDVEVVYTRRRDKFVPLQERANIANAAKGDLFVSIHTNSLDKRNKNRNKIKGTATYTLGLHRTEDNLEVAMRENSVISLEEDYTTTYKGFDPNSAESYIINEIYQNHYLEQSVDFASLLQKEFKATAGRIDRGVRQAGFLVIRETAMPSVLVELDFICNPTQEKYMASEEGQKALAESLYNALVEYRRLNHDGNAKQFEPQKPEQREDDSKQPLVDKGGSEIVYKVQILAGRSKLPSNSSEFKGLKGVERHKSGNIYKYTYGSTTDPKEAEKILRKVKRKFKDAYIVTSKNGKLE